MIFNFIYNKLIIVWNMYRLRLLHVPFGKKLRIRGNIGLQIHNAGKMSMGNNVTISSGNMSNPMGRNIKAFIRVDRDATLTIGNNVGMSSVTIWCSESITVGDNVKVGALTIISDTDAHSINPIFRSNPDTDAKNAKHSPIVIKKNAFIGAMCFIGKGCCIGENSIVGAGSIVTKNIPDNEIWAGNPAKFIKRIDIE